MKQIIYVVNPDISLCNRLASLLTFTSLAIKTFECFEDFQAQSHTIAPGSLLIIDSEIQGLNIIEYLEELKQKKLNIYVIVMGKEDDVPQAVKIIRAGATEIVSKPFTDQKLKTCIKNILSSETKENTDI